VVPEVSNRKDLPRVKQITRAKS